MENNINTPTNSTAVMADLKLSLLITSGLANLFVLIAWLVLNYGTGYQLIIAG